MEDKRPIGFIDSGVGGLTVVKELKRLLPGENIIYFGDNANVPYGNRSEEEIYKLTKKMVDFLVEKEVKLIAIACNTISSILENYFQDSGIDIISIIEPAADYVSRNKLDKVGILATKFTIESAAYDRLIKKKDDRVEVFSEACPSLAGIIDRGEYSDKEIEEVVGIHMDNILKKRKLENIVLGCTHYPIVIDKFQAQSPTINFINPAYEQIKYIERLMEEKSMVGKKEGGKFEIYTTGTKEVYIKMLDLLKIKEPDHIYTIDLL